jgi:DNA-binding NarL/FixJ family response regulator
MTPAPVHVLLADDHTLVRGGIRRILESQPGVRVLAEAADGPGALALVDAHPEADLLVLDLTMPGLDGNAVLLAAKRKRPDLKVVVLTMHAGQEYVTRALRGGADAYLLKDSAVQDLVAALEAVMAGRSYFSPAVQARLAGVVRGDGGVAAHSPALTEREREVLRALARGGSSREVAAALGISVRTVETHRANIMQKFGVKSVALLIQAAMREGLLDGLDPP